MPLTPRFSLRQTPTHVHIEISVPSFRLSAGQDGGMEVVLMGENNSEFHFYAKPYLLKLNFFPNGFVDQDDDCKGLESGVGTAKYDPSEQTVTVPLLKQKKSDNDDDENENKDDNHWHDLDLTARMIQPKEIPKKWLHAVVDKGDGEINGTMKDGEEEKGRFEAESGNTNIHDNLLNSSGGGEGYGFASIFRNILTDYCRSGLSQEMLQLKLDPENSSIDERRDERMEHESNNFDFERYLADLELSEDSTDDYLYPMVMAYKPWWRTTQPQMPKSTTTESLWQDLDRLAINANGQSKEPKMPTTVFSDDEKLLLSTIPYPLLPKSLQDTSNSKQNYRLWCGLLELLLAYVYDHLATTGDSTVESAWTIFVLSPGLSWLDGSPSKSVEKTTKAFLRRVLVYPYWRNVEGLGRKVLMETLALMQNHGVHGITKALLQIRAILDKSEVHYLGNKLLVDPYLYWIQNLKRPQDEDGGTDRILTELSNLVHNDKNFERIVQSVEQSLGIDEMMEEFFGNDEDEESNNETASSSSSSEEDSDSEEDNFVHKNENKALAVELLDDQIGQGTDEQKPSILYCVGDSKPPSSAERPLITEVRSETKKKKTRLIEEL